MQDEEIIPFLSQRRRSTLFTLDLGFYKHAFCHGRYCLVCMDVEQYEAAAFVRRLLHHKEFNTESTRMGTVIRISQSGLRVWRLHEEKEAHFGWA
jgi:hypothetical protein